MAEPDEVISPKVTTIIFHLGSKSLWGFTTLLSTYIVISIQFFLQSLMKVDHKMFRRIRR